MRLHNVTFYFSAIKARSNSSRFIGTFKKWRGWGWSWAECLTSLQEALGLVLSPESSLQHSYSPPPHRLSLIAFLLLICRNPLYCRSLIPGMFMWRAPLLPPPLSPSLPPSLPYYCSLFPPFPYFPFPYSFPLCSLSSFPFFSFPSVPFPSQPLPPFLSSISFLPFPHLVLEIEPAPPACKASALYLS